MQRPNLSTLSEGFIGSNGLIHGLLGQKGDNGVHLGVDQLDLGQVRLHHLLGR